MSDGSALAPETWVDQHRDALYRFALRRVTDPELADDLVQEALLEGLRCRSSFTGGSSVRTWLTAILKHKIIDEYRRSRRAQRAARESSSEPATEGLFEPGTRWKSPPGPWDNEAEAILDRSEFREVLSQCVLRLPEHLADAFVAIELGDLDRDRACEQYQITAANLSVRLYRARLLLRHCLEIHWFAETAPMARSPSVRRSDLSAEPDC